MARMKVAIIGTSGQPLPFGYIKKILPRKKVRLIIGSNYKIDDLLVMFAFAYRYRLTRLFPENENYYAINETIRKVIQEADKVLIFWDGAFSKTEFAIKECISMKKDFTLYTTFRKF